MPSGPSSKGISDEPDRYPPKPGRLHAHQTGLDRHGFLDSASERAQSPPVSVPMLRVFDILRNVGISYEDKTSNPRPPIFGNSEADQQHEPCPRRHLGAGVTGVVSTQVAPSIATGSPAPS